MNVALLREVKAHILADPDSFRMDQWSCGTAHCIAGWALLLSGVPIDVEAGLTVSDEFPSIVAREVLQIDGKQGHRLFHEPAWPIDFFERHFNARTRRKRAEIAAKRIDHFIATEGRK